MTICGYNETIGRGLRLLIQGMIEALERKSEACPINELLDREVVELEAMIETLGVDDRNTLAQMFVGLNFLARALFEQVRQNQSNASDTTWHDEMRSIGEAFNILLSRTEDHGEQRRAAGEGRPPQQFAKELARWALQNCDEDGLLSSYRVGESHLSATALKDRP